MGSVPPLLTFVLTIISGSVHRGEVIVIEYLSPMWIVYYRRLDNSPAYTHYATSESEMPDRAKPFATQCGTVLEGVVGPPGETLPTLQLAPLLGLKGMTRQT
jgi:hypothetical protein